MRHATNRQHAFELAQRPAIELAAAGEPVFKNLRKTGQPDNAYLQLFFRNPMPMWIYQPESLRFLEVNDAMVQAYGFSREEFLTMRLQDIRPISDIPRMIHSAKLRKGGLVTSAGLFEHVTKAGKHRFVDISSHVIEHDGQPAVLVMGRDVTEAHEAKVMLGKAEKDNHRILESITDGVCSVDFEYNVLYWNSAAEDIMDLPRERIVGKNLWHVFGEDNASLFRPHYDRAMQLQRSERFTSRFDPLDLWVEISVDPSETGLSIYFRDITESKKNIDRIRKANEQYEMLTNATNDVIYEWNLADDLVYWGKGYETLFGHQRSSPGLPVSSWRENLPDEERAELIERTQQAFRNKETSLQRELRFRCADGTFKTVFDKLVIQYNDHGKPVRLVGAMQDITDRKNQETAIVALNEELTRKAGELAVSNRELARLQRCMTDATIRGQEQERKQLGEELHDNINQILATAKLYLDHAISTNNLESGLVGQCKDLIGMATTEIRNLSHSLLPPSLDDFGVRRALDELVARMETAQVFQINTRFDKIDETALQSDQKLTIYRIAQEQLNNIVKHAGATQVWMMLNRSANGQHIEFSIRDNGRGFNTKSKKTGVGLRNIISRVEHFFGKAKIISSPGNGCEVRISFPVGVKVAPLDCLES